MPGASEEEPLWHIRRGRPADAGALARFAARTFQETFAHVTAPDDMAAHLARAYGEAQQGAELTERGTITLIAESTNGIAGFAQVRWALAPECVADRDSIELRRFYVDRPFHGRGLAVSLMAAAEDAVRELGGTRVWLSVFQHNDRAIAFYSRRGFAHVGNAVFMVGSDAQTDRIMVKDLRQNPTGS